MAESAPALTLIDGPYSVMMWDRMAKDPDDPSKMYTWNHYDVVRMENGTDQGTLGRGADQSARSQVRTSSRERSM